MLRSGKVEVYCHADPTFRIKRVLQAEVIQKQVCRDTRVRGRVNNFRLSFNNHPPASVEPLQMAGSSKTNRKEGNVRVEHECPLNLLTRDIWVKIATKVASNSIHDLFNMQASCKVFLDAASSEAVYQHVTMRVIPLVSFLFYLDRPERRFIDRCVEAGNADAILRQGLTEYFWIAGRGIGMELLSRAWTEGCVEAETSKAVGSSSRTFSGSAGLTRGHRIREMPWLVGPPLALPAATWLV
ncbi:hypothetical protein HN873_038623 [Arachis hypogaea]